MNLIISLKEKYNIAICINYLDIEDFKKFEEAGIPFYFNFRIDSWDVFHYYVSLNVSDIFISGELGFDLKRVSRIAKGKGIRLRAYANYSVGFNPFSNGFKDFYIRPEDVDKYSEYIDVLEFWDSVDKQNVLYEVYFHDKEWNGNLQEIIQGLKVKINNYYILGPEFGRRRMNCRRKCQKGEGCQLCERLVELAETLENSPDYEVFERR